MVIPNTVSRGTCSACKDDIIVTSHNNWTHLCVGGPHKRELPQHFNQSQFSLKHSKPHTNAVSRAMSEWHVTQLWALGLPLRGEPTEGNISELSYIYRQSLNLSGMNLSGSSQYCGSLCRCAIGTVTDTPFGIVRSLMVMVLVHRRRVLHKSYKIVICCNN